MRITVFDQIAAIGGSLGLFTGVSLITFVEIAYWGLRMVLASFYRMRGNTHSAVTSISSGSLGVSGTEGKNPNDAFGLVF